MNEMCTLVNYETEEVITKRLFKLPPAINHHIEIGMTRYLIIDIIHQFREDLVVGENITILVKPM